MRIETKTKYGIDERSKQNATLDNLEPLLKRLLPEMKEDLIPGLPADLIRREKLRKRLFPDKEDD